jgi:hypothetical protein
VLTAASQVALRRILAPSGGTRPAASERPGPQAAAPTLIKVEDPLEDVDAIVARQMDGDPVGRRANRVLRRRGGAKQVGRLPDGTPTLDGRECCARLAADINRCLHRLTMPAEYRCECGTVWRVENRVREERRHV